MARRFRLTSPSYRRARRVVALLLVGLPAGAWAQEQPTEFRLPEIAVTGSKRGMDPLRLDGTQRSETSEALAVRGITSIDGIDRLFPGMLIRSRSSMAYGNITLRGQTSADFYNPSVQVLVDGLPQDFSLLGQLLPMQLDRVDVLYGPQGTLYGAGAVGGVINVVTRRPDNTFRFGGEAGYSSRQRDAGAFASGPIVPDMLYGDISVRWRERFGNYHPPGGRPRDENDDFGGNRDFSGQVRLRYAPTGSPWDVMVTAGRSITRSSEEQFVLGQAGIQSRQALPFPSHYRLATTSLGLNASYDLGGAVITALTGYQDRDLDRTVFGTYTPEKQRSFTQELRIASTPQAGRPVDYVAGLWFQDIDFERRIPGQVSSQNIRSFAGFGEATWHVMPRLDLTAGLRFDTFRTEAPASGILSLSGARDETAVTPKVAVGYQVTDAIRLFALYSNGFKPGGFTRTVTPLNFAFTYGRARTDNVEAGIRMALPDGRLEASAAAYYSYTRGFQAFVGQQPIQYLQNVGDVRSYGVDFRVTARPLTGLRIDAALGLNNAEYASYRDPTGHGQNYEGNRPAYAPRVTANLDVSYTATLPRDLGQLVPRFGVTYVSRTYFDEANTVSQGSYALLDASLSWAINRNLTATVYGNNLTNHHYATYGFTQPGIGTAYQLGMGREVGLRVSASF
nr:TonB-dependent receptor [uncultured Roseococcus sp.]